MFAEASGFSILLFVSVIFHTSLPTFCHDMQTFTKEFARTKRSEESTLNSDNTNRQKRDTVCNSIPDVQNVLSPKTTKHIFSNDENPAISLTWSGNQGVMLALTTRNFGISFRPSRLYRSTNRGQSFVDISDQIGHDTIRKSNGIHLSPNDSGKIILIGYVSPFTSTFHTNIYVSTDTGATFQKAICPFIMDATTLTFSPTDDYSLLAKSTNNSLFMSTDFGREWKLVKNQVHTGKWDPIVKHLFYYTFDPSGRMSSKSTENELYKQMSTATSGTLLAQHVHSFAVQNDFLFLSVQFPGNNGSRVMHISKDQGQTWNAAQLPLINPDQFYSILDMSESMVFVHVDAAGDTGHGNIYTSEERGIIFSKSLTRHLYPNTQGITDFYRVKSLPGVYITSQLTKDNTVHSRITFDKGGVWDSISSPAGSHCPSSEKECKLQIHNYFSASKHVSLPALPLSSPSAVGIIMAHGNLGDGLNFNPPNVFLTNDGGYTWKQPANLSGPYHYGIGDSGGILFAVPSKSELVNTIRFSFDEGDCWHSYKFTDTPIQITGISAEPGEKSTDVSIWGWNRSGDGSWMAITVDFRPAMGDSCGREDYQKWTAHETNTLSDEGCLLGEKKMYFRRAKGSLCVNDQTLVNNPVGQPCACQYSDYICDYAYVRNDQSMCVKDPAVATSNMDICIDNEEEVIETKGYRKIPGDKCQGGVQPNTKTEDLKKSCAKPQIIDEEFGVDPNDFVSYTPRHTSRHIGLVIFLVIIVIMMGVALGVLLYRKRKTMLRVRYTPLAQDDNEAAKRANGSAVHPLVGTSSLVDDDDDTVIVDPSSLANMKPKNGATLSYHDDSDEDLLVT
uniref:Sortilin-like n=1 Tax=Phallusia mammillata TaxID=59560 RepID=A0A6F9DTX5_9ASCI|nr:sortilin-like [Phallusia mammillata]